MFVPDLNNFTTGFFILTWFKRYLLLKYVTCYTRTAGVSVSAVFSLSAKVSTAGWNHVNPENWVSNKWKQLLKIK